ncbi:MAG TPA: RDD family protein [Terracidiphilus sp.]|nr:RDD family protein [Terracidiphilus sp.]
MSTAQANLFEWKQEVNRRLAEHRSRKGAAAAGTRVVTATQTCGSGRGAEAAARVAQRFAHAPSYTQELVEAARPLRAEEARHAAVAAETIAEPLPAIKVGVEAAPWERLAETHASTAVVEVRGEDERNPIRHVQNVRGGAQLFGGAAAAEFFEAPVKEWEGPDAAEELESTDPIHANLIEFPRELVATRKIRPRLVEGPLASVRNGQLSIFEVEAEAVSTEVEPADAKAAREWSQPEWSGIKLDARPAEEMARAAELAANAAVATEIELAPLSRRLLAVFVDATLIGAAVIAAGWMFMENTTALPGPREMAIGAVAAFAVVAVFYELLFFTLAHATPGMRYAHIGLWTFANQRPTREQRQRRLWATALSVLPVGLGLVWSLFDEERLCWHDRLSQTYLRSSF